MIIINKFNIGDKVNLIEGLDDNTGICQENLNELYSKENLIIVKTEYNEDEGLWSYKVVEGYWFLENELIKVVDGTLNNNLYFAKVRETAKIPTKDDENMGYDIYADFEEDYMLINPHETKMIPTGICSACSEDYAIVLKERGSTGTKGIAQRCGVIDSGYRGEWFVPVTNTNNNPLVIIKDNEELIDDLALDHIIYPYTKGICQAVVLPVPKMNVQEISLEELKAIPSKRKEGKIGSSGK